MDIVGSAKALKEIIFALAALITSYSTIRGINIWKEQFEWKKHKDIEERIMLSTYKIRNSFENARIFDSYANSLVIYHIMFNSNLHTREPENFEKVDIVMENFNTRYNKLIDDITELESLIPEGEFLYGVEIKFAIKNFRTIYQCLKKSFAQYTYLIDNLDSKPLYPDPESESLQRILFSIPNQTDTFAPKIDVCVNNIYQILKNKHPRPMRKV